MGRSGGSSRGSRIVVDEMEQGLNHRQYRRFGVGDGLILVAALALTLVGLRGQAWFTRVALRVPFWWETSRALLGFRPWNVPYSTRGQAASWVAGQFIDELLVQLLASVLLGLTLTQPLLRLRRPRPPFREIIRQSGLVACLGVILGTFVIVDIQWSTGADVMSRLPVLPLVLLWPILGLFPWRTEASWIDRLGRAVGIGWLVVVAAGAAARYLGS
jgi:hypothetical protein